MDIPSFSTVSSSDDSSDPSYSYTILFDNGTSASIPLREMASIIPKLPVDIDSSDSQDSLLPPFLRLDSKITYEHDGQYHKGFLDKRQGIYRFIFKSHANKCKEEWGVDLPNLPTTWVNLCVEGIFVPGHVSHSFLCSSTSFTNPPLIQSPLLSAPPTSIVNVPPHYSKPLQIHILTRKFGWLVIGRRKRGLKVLTLTAKLLSVNIVLFAKKVRLKLFLLCAC